MTETLVPVDSATLAISAEMRAQHDKGPHICLDGRRYVGSCLVTDPTCAYLTLGILNRDANGRPCEIAPGVGGTVYLRAERCWHEGGLWHELADDYRGGTAKC